MTLTNSAVAENGTAIIEGIHVPILEFKLICKLFLYSKEHDCLNTGLPIEVIANKCGQDILRSYIFTKRLISRKLLVIENNVNILTFPEQKHTNIYKLSQNAIEFLNHIYEKNPKKLITVKTKL